MNLSRDEFFARMRDSFTESEVALLTIYIFCHDKRACMEAINAIANSVDINIALEKINRNERVV